MINKVFGIGLSHTGTKSLNEALNLLGIKAIHWPIDPVTYRELSSGNYDLTILKTYQAITDITVSSIYPQLDKLFPGSKFILTVRNKAQWLRGMAQTNEGWIKAARQSFISRFFDRLLEMLPHQGLAAFKSAWALAGAVRMIEFVRISIYGAISFQNMDRLSNLYDLHIRNVLEYFEGRPNDLLVLDICDGEGWEKLCSFLSLPVPQKSFPKVDEKIRPVWDSEEMFDGSEMEKRS